MLWDINRREQETTKGASRIKGFEDFPTFLQAASCHDSHHVPFLRAVRGLHRLRC